MYLVLVFSMCDSSLHKRCDSLLHPMVIKGLIHIDANLMMPQYEAVHNSAVRVGRQHGAHVQFLGS